MLKFKKDFENHSIALSDGTLIDRHSIGSAHAQEKLAAAPWFDFMLEKAEEPQAEAPKTKASKTKAPQAETLTDEPTND
jgi:hypothetical protein